MNIEDIVKKIKADSGQSIREIVWEMVLQNAGKGLFVSVIDALRKDNPKLAIDFAEEVIDYAFRIIEDNQS